MAARLTCWDASQVQSSAFQVQSSEFSPPQARWHLPGARGFGSAFNHAPGMLRLDTGAASMACQGSDFLQPMTTPRNGILAGGSWIVDAVKIIDVWPQQDTLANIFSTTKGSGGSPFNILVDLALLGAGFPLAGAGLVGDDDLGRWIFDLCKKHGIDCSALQSTAEAPTSFTGSST